MTESEFIKEKQKILKSMPDTICLTRAEAKSILEELEQYREMGTVEEIRDILQVISEGQDDVDESGVSTGLLHTLLEYAKYKKIGTVEECREAVEKQKPKTPDIWGDGYSDGTPVYDMYDCPNCGKSYEIECDHYKYCPECGQAMNMEDLKEG